jgi:hypothetical protein
MPAPWVIYNFDNMARLFLPKACLFSSMQLLRELGQMFAGKNWQSFGKFIEFFIPVYTIFLRPGRFWKH